MFRHGFRERFVQRADQFREFAAILPGLFAGHVARRGGAESQRHRLGARCAAFLSDLSIFGVALGDMRALGRLKRQSGSGGLDAPRAVLR